MRPAGLIDLGDLALALAFAPGTFAPGALALALALLLSWRVLAAALARALGGAVAFAFAVGASWVLTGLPRSFARRA